MKRAEISTKQLSEITGVGSKTIRRMAYDLDGIPVGGKRGWIFPASAPQQVVRLLRERHENSNRRNNGKHLKKA